MFGRSNIESRLLKTVDNVEKHQGNEVLTAKELFKLSKKHYTLMQDYLMPIVHALSEHLNIQNIYFQKDNSYELLITIEYINNKKGFLSIGYSDSYKGIDIIADTSNGLYNKIIYSKKNIILHSLDEWQEKNYSDEIDIDSTSKFFNIKMNGNIFKIQMIPHNYNEYFKLSYVFNSDDIKKDNSPLEKFNIQSNSDLVIKKLKDKEMLYKFLENITFYERDIPKSLVKKIQ